MQGFPLPLTAVFSWRLRGASEEESRRANGFVVLNSRLGGTAISHSNLAKTDCGWRVLADTCLAFPM